MKVTICFSGETPVDTDRPIDVDTRGEVISHVKEVIVHTGMENFHMRLVAGISVTATHTSAILTINRDKKREILLAVRIKNRQYISYRMAARIVAHIISK